MSPWRLELLRIWRTRRLVALATVYLLLGLGLPVLSYYLPELLKHPGNGVIIIAPKQTPNDAIQGFANNTAQFGTLVLVIVAAATLAVDANPILAAFYRTRVHSPIRLLLPRYLTVTTAGIAALALGTIAAWYETELLLGHVPTGALLGGFGLQALWLCFATSTVGLITTTTRSILGAIGIAIGSLLTLALLGNITVLSSWLPTRLSGSTADLLRHHTAGLWHAILVTALATVAAVALAIRRSGRRELRPTPNRRLRGA